MAELVTSDGTDLLLRAFWAWSWEFWLWCASSAVWSFLETHADDLLVHAVARFDSGRFAWNLFTFSESYTVDFKTEAFFELHASHTIFRENGTLWTITTFNTLVDAFLFDNMPLAEVIASLWTRANTSVVVSSTIALHWAEALVSPLHGYTLGVTSLSVSSNCSTQTFAFSTGIASASIKLTVVKVVLWVDVVVTLGKWTVLVLEDRTSLGRPSLSEWILGADIPYVGWWGTSGNRSPRMGELENVFGGNASSSDKILLDIAVKVTAETSHLTLVFWGDLDDHMGTSVPLKGDAEILSGDEYPETGKPESEGIVSVLANWRASDNADAGIAGLEVDALGTYCTLGTASLVDSADFKLALDLGIDVLALSLESVSLTVKALDMGVTISLASTSAPLSRALPVTGNSTGALVTILSVALASSVGSAAVVAWALFSDNTLTSGLLQDESVDALASRLTVEVKVWVDSLISVHVKASCLDWLEAVYEFLVGTAILILILASLSGTLPVALVAFADVAVLSSAFTGKVLSSVEEAATLGLSDALALMTENVVVWALATWDAGLAAFDLVAVLESTASSEASLTALLEYLAAWTVWHANGFLSPVFNNNAVLGAVHSVEGGSGTGYLGGWVVTVVLLTLVLVWLVVDVVVTLFEVGAVEDGALLLGVWVSLLVHYAWLERVLSWWLDALGVGLPLLNKVDNRVLDVALWGGEVVIVLAVKVTAKTTELTLVLWAHSKIDGVLLVPHHSSALASDGDELSVESLDEYFANVNWESGNSLALDMDGAAGEELDYGTLGVEYKGSSAFVSRAIVIDHDERVVLVNSLKNDVAALSSEGVVLAVKGSHVALGDRTHRVAFVFSAVELTAQADALVTVSSESLSWLEDFLAIEAWALLDGNASAVVSILVEWAVAAVDTVLVAAASRVWVVATWGARGAAWLVLLSLWAFHWASALHSPVDVDAVSAALSEVGGHRVAWGARGEVVVAVEADVLLTGFKVWGWVDDAIAWGVHEVATEHDSLGRLSHALWGLDSTVGLLGSVWALVGVLPGVGEESNALDNIAFSGHEVIVLVVIEHTAKTTGLADEVLVDSDKDGLVTVPLEGPGVGGLLDNDVVGDSGDVKRVERVWKGENLARLGSNDWTVVTVGNAYPGIGDVDVDLSAALGVWAAVSVVFYLNGERSRENVFDERVVAGTSESEHLTVKSSVVMLAPGHAVASLFWVDLTSVHNAQDLTDIVLVDVFFLLDALWEVWVWVPLTVGARVVVAHWDGRDKLESLLTGWVASKLTFLVLAADLSVDWSIKVLALLGGTDATWVSLAASWEGWRVGTVLEVTDEQIGGFASVAVLAYESTYLDAISNRAVDLTVNWVECVTVVGSAWNKLANVASLHLYDDDRVLLWHESTATVESVLVARSIFGDEDFTGLDLDVLDLVVFEFGDYLSTAVGVDSPDKSGHLLLVHESNENSLAIAGAAPVWGDWAYSSPSIGRLTDAVDNMAVGIGGIVLGVGVVATADTGGGEAESSSDKERVLVEDHSNAIYEIDDNNGVVLSVHLEGIGKLDWIGALVDSIGLALEDESGRVAGTGEHESTGLLLTLVDQVVAGSSVVIESELVQVETAGALEESHLAAGSLVAKESTVERLVPLALGPDSAGIVPVIMGWQVWALGGWASVANALWGLLAGCGSGSFDLSSFGIDAPAVEVLVALKRFVGTAGGTVATVESASGGSSASLGKWLINCTIVRYGTVPHGHLAELPLSVLAVDVICEAVLLLEHEPVLAGDLALAIERTLKIGILRCFKMAALVLSGGEGVQPGTLGGAAGRQERHSEARHD